MELQKSIKALIYPGEQRGYVAECIEISVVTQGDTLDEVADNLREVVALHLEGEYPAEFGLVRNPSLIVTTDCTTARICLDSKDYQVPKLFKFYQSSLSGTQSKRQSR